MKKILIISVLLFGYIGMAQQYHDKGAKFENATDIGNTITTSTRIPIIDEFGLVNYYVDVADLFALNPVPPASDLQSVTEVGRTTNLGIVITGEDISGQIDGLNLEHEFDRSVIERRTSGTSDSYIWLQNQGATFPSVQVSGRLGISDAINPSDAVTLNQLDNVTITESQITDLKDYLRGDINDTNGANKLTLGSLEVTGQTILQNGLNMTSVPVGTSDNILTLNQTTGDVEQRVFSLGNIDIANSAGISQFSVGLDEQLRFAGLNDASVSFDAGTKTITVSATGGSSGEGGVDTFNGRDGAVVSQAGDYSTTQVSEGTNLYFTEPRVRATPLTGLTIANTPISSTNTFLQALGRLQGQINDRYTIGESDGRYVDKVSNESVGGIKTFTGSKLSIVGGAPVFEFSRNSAAPGEKHMYLINNGTNFQYRFYSDDYSSFSVPIEIYRAGINATEIHLNSPLVSLNGDVDMVGTASGAANNTLLRFKDLGGNTQGYIGRLGQTYLRIQNSLSGQGLVLHDSGGGNGFQFNDGVGFRTVFHAGNHRSDSQNDARYAILNATNTGSLTVTSTVTASNFILSSDIRLKENIRPLGNGYYSFNFKDDKTKSKRYGVIAQEVEKYAPELVSEGEDGYKKVAYIDLLIKKIAELTKRVEELEKK